MKMDTFKVGDHVHRRHRPEFMRGVVVKVTQLAHGFRDSANSRQRVRVRWSNGHEGSLSGAQVQKAAD